MDKCKPWSQMDVQELSSELDRLQKVGVVPGSFQDKLRQTQIAIVEVHIACRWNAHDTRMTV